MSNLHVIDEHTHKLDTTAAFLRCNRLARFIDRIAGTSIKHLNHNAIAIGLNRQDAPDTARMVIGITQRLPRRQRDIVALVTAQRKRFKEFGDAMSVVWKILDTLTDLDALTPARQLPHRNSGDRLPCRPRDMKDIDKTSNLQKANNFT